MYWPDERSDKGLDEEPDEASYEGLARDRTRNFLVWTAADRAKRDDMAILCERHTTSKLKEFEDLTSIGTYGFRGEALASISHIAHLTITTKTQESNVAYKAYYTNEKLTPLKPGQSADPKPCSGRQGTQITVEDLFYNIPTRRRAFKSVSEEYARILDVVGRYAVHCKGVAFSCKKHGDNGVGLAVPSNAKYVDRIRLVYNSAIANDLIPFEAANDRWGFKSDGLISSANNSAKRTTLLLFINHRSVDNSAIKKAIEQTYLPFLSKGGHPFVYLSLEIDPARVDVNVHPTKREVNFLNEEEIIEVVCDEIRTRLGKVDTSRTFMTQSLLGSKTGMTGMTAAAPTIPTIHTQKGMPFSTPSLNRGDSSTSQKTPTPKSQRPYENNLVRVDAKVRKITSMLPPAVPSLSNNAASHSTSDEMDYEYSDKEHTIIRLTTIKDLRASVRDELHNGLADVFANHIFVGIVDISRRIAAIQSGVKLFLIDYGLICAEFFYQLGLTEFSNFGSIQFQEPLDLTELLRIGAESEKMRMLEEDQELDWDEVVQVTVEQLVEKRDMLVEYFSLEVSEDGKLIGIPLMHKGYMPSMAKLPTFLLRLGPHVEWDDEGKCFESFLRELASFYAPEALPVEEKVAVGLEERQVDELRKKRVTLERVVENVLCPAFRTRLVATKSLMKGVVEVADLKGLYRVFERC